MRKDKFRKAAALIASAALAASAASCGKGASSKDAPETAESLANAFKSSAVDCGELGLLSVNEMAYVQSSGKLLIGGRDEDSDESGLDAVYSADADLKNFRKIDLGVEKPENGSVDSCVRFGADGNVYAFALVRDYGDYKLPDVDDPDYDAEKNPIDYEEIEKHAKKTAYIKSCDSDGKELATIDVAQDWVDKLGGRDFIMGFAALNDSYVVEMLGAGDQALTFFDKEGKPINKVGVDDGSVNSFAPAASGELVATICADDGAILRFFGRDGSASSREDVSIPNEYFASLSGCFPEDCEAAYITDKGYFGVKDGKPVELLNFANSNIDYQSVGGIAPLGGGEFLLAENEGGKVSLSRLSACDVEELKNVGLITLGLLWEDPTISLKVTEFNRNNSEFRIKTVNYGENFQNDIDSPEAYNNYRSKTVEALKKDIISGKGPDIVVCDDRGFVMNLGKKGAFADLYAMLENDPDLKKDDILPNILEIGEADGKLVGLVPQFDVYTIMLKKKYVPEDGWTMDDLIKLYDERPANCEFFSSASKDSVLSMFLYSTDVFVDEKNAKCSFDGDDFIKLLEFANKFPKEYKDIDYDSITEEDFRNFMREESLAYRNDKYLAEQTSFYDIREFKRAELATFGEAVKAAGYPFGKGNGGSLTPSFYVSVMNDSSYKDKCWEFVKQFFNKDSDDELMDIPSLKSKFEAFIDAGMEKLSYTDEKGEKEYFDDVCYVGDKEITIPVLTREECDAIKEYILGAESIGQAYSADVYRIIGEEVEPFFAGERTAEQAADAIQNRVSILLSEQS